MKVSIRANVLLSNVLTIILVFIMLTPYMINNGNNYIKIAVFIVWVVSWFLFAPSERILNNTLFVFPVLFLILQIIYIIIGFSGIGLLSVIDRMPIYFVPLYADIAIERMTKSELKIVSSSIFAIFLFNLIINAFFEGNSLDGGLWVSSQTNYVFSVAIMVLICLYIVISKLQGSNQLKYWTVLVLGTYYLIFVNSRAISTIVLVVCGTMLLFTAYVWKDNQKSYARGMVVLVLMAVLLVNIESIVGLMANFTGNEWMGEKVNDLVAFINGDEIKSYGSLNMRLTLYEASIRTFLSSPLKFVFGTGEQAIPVASLYYAKLYGIGGHSEFFDLAGEYGLIGIAIVFIWFKNVYNRLLIPNVHVKKRNKVRCVWLMLILYGFVNNIVYGNVFWLMLCYFPIILALMQKENAPNIIQCP